MRSKTGLQQSCVLQAPQNASRLTHQWFAKPLNMLHAYKLMYKSGHWAHSLQIPITLCMQLKSSLVLSTQPRCMSQCKAAVKHVFIQGSHQ